MNERLKAHIDDLFMGAPHTHQAADIKEELTSNLQAKYDDLAADGMDAEEAFQNVVSGIGDIQSLLGAEQIQEVTKTRKRSQLSSILKGVAITLYILAGIPAILFSELLPSLEILGIMGTLAIAAVATGIMVYAVSIKPKKYKKGDDTFVEEYKEKVTGGAKMQRLRGAVSSTLWLLVVTVYLAVSFITMQWHITWLIFLAGALLQNMILFLMGDPGGSKKIVGSAIWMSAIIGYFIISFSTMQWGWAAFIFLAAALVQQFIRLIRIWNEE